MDVSRCRMEIYTRGSLEIIYTMVKEDSFLDKVKLYMKENSKKGYFMEKAK